MTTHDWEIKLDERVNGEFYYAIVFCIIAGITPFLVWMYPMFKPDGEAIGAWVQRSGAVTTVFAVLVQVKAVNILELTRPSTGETHAFYKKYKHWQSVLSICSLLLIVVGTIVWGYGELLIKLT